MFIPDIKLFNSVTGTEKLPKMVRSYKDRWVYASTL